jgi:hypothetical protein
VVEVLDFEKLGFVWQPNQMSAKLITLYGNKVAIIALYCLKGKC